MDPTPTSATRALRLTWTGLALCAACATTEGVVPVAEYRAEPTGAGGAYVIAEGDLVAVRVFGQEGMSGSVRVRSDGKISLPFVNEQQAAQLTPAALADQLQVALKPYVVNPLVVVSLEEQRLNQVSVLGAVLLPGLYPLKQGTGLLQAVALAGGLTPFAARDRIFVLRVEPATRGPRRAGRIAFTWDAVTSGRGPAAAFELRDGDVLVIED